MKLGIVGLPNVGKSTLFNAITNAKAQSANYPFCTIEPNVGMVLVPDNRLEKLAELYNPEKVTPAVIEFVDIAGLVRGASKGEGLGNKFLSHIREVDAIVHVVRCFESDDITHVEGSVDPERDRRILNMELILADIETCQKRIERLEKLLKSDKNYGVEVVFLKKVYETLSAEKPAIAAAKTDEEKTFLRNAFLLTAKPVIYVANLSENDFSAGLDKNPYYKKLMAAAYDEKAEVLPICAELEEEISTLSKEDKALFLSDLGLLESGLDRLITASYQLLGLISFLTAGAPEVRAWTIQKGTKAPFAAGKIHSDIERGFIRAEVIGYDELMGCGSMVKAKECGLVRSEGKDYVVKDGDVVLFRFNV